MSALLLALTFAAFALLCAWACTLLHRSEPLLSGIFAGVALMAACGAGYNLIEAVLS